MAAVAAERRAQAFDAVAECCADDGSTMSGDFDSCMGGKGLTPPDFASLVPGGLPEELGGDPAAGTDATEAPPATEDIVERGPLTLDVKRLTAHWQGKRVDLTLTEFWMVHAMVRYPGHVKTREQLMREAQVVVDDATITSHIKRIRRKFQALDAAFDEIDTVHGAGYRWRA